MRALRLATLVALASTGVATADRRRDVTVVVQPTEHDKELLRIAPMAPLAGTTIFLNQCVGGCTVKPGDNNAQADTSAIVSAPSMLSEHAFTGTQWTDFVTCMKEIYSPYDVVVTDVRPQGGYNMIYVAGTPGEAGLQDGIEGIAPITNDCTPVTAGVAFAFANATAADEDDNNFVWALCWTAGQEVAHTFGLDHEYEFVDIMQSACSDPMTYRDDCGGEKFFRNYEASCGEFGPARPACGPSNNCGTTQNSHQKLLAVLGAGTPITAKPVIALNVPMAGATVKAGTPVIGTGSAQRGIATVELWLNGYKWGSAPGVAYGQAGQPSAPYTLTIPSGVPDSKIDLVLKAFDDIGIEGDTTTITVVQGKASGCDPTVANPDGTIDTCLKGQQCTDGKCAWTDANMGVFGDACTYDQFCTANLECQGTATSEICTHDCDPTIMDSCPMGYECIASGTSGVCFTQQPDGTGCCSAGSDGVPAVALSFGTLGLLLRRRRGKS